MRDDSPECESCAHADEPHWSCDKCCCYDQWQSPDDSDYVDEDLIDDEWDDDEFED